MAAFAALALVAAACGDDDPGGTQATDPPATEPGATNPTTSGTGSGPATTAAPMKQGGTFRWAWHGGPDTDDFINFQTNYRCTSGCVSMFPMVFDSLVSVEPGTLRIFPQLAERWEVNADATEFTFYLRKDAKFHDGTPVTAEDVEFSWDRVCNAEELKPGSGNACTGLIQYERGEVIDEHTFKAHLKIPQPDFLVTAAGRATYLGIVPKAAVLEAGQVEFGENPIGSGAYRFVEWVKGDHITLERNPDYNWGPPFGVTKGGPPLIDRVVFSYIADAQTRLNALLTGQVDGADRLDPSSFKQIQANSRLKLIRAKYNGLPGYLYVNTQQGPTADVNVRRAISAAIDREALNQSVFAGEGVPTTAFLVEGMKFADITQTAPAYDLTAAKKYLADAGYTIGSDGWATKNGERLAFDGVVVTSNGKVYEFVQAQLKQIGIDMTVKTMSAAEANATRDKLQFGLWNSAAVGFGNTLAAVLYTVFHSSRIPPNGFNPSFFDNAEFDKVITDATSLPDDAQRAAAYKRAQEILAEEVPVIPYLRMDTGYAYDVKFDGIEPDTSGAYRSFHDLRLA